MTETEVERGRAMSKAMRQPLEDGKYIGSALELLERMQPSPLILGLLTLRTIR